MHFSESLKLDTEHITIDENISVCNIRIDVMRLDKIHPVISGNKIFKLRPYLAQALNEHHRTVLTFGGAYSNHLLATAFACRSLGLQSIGLVRDDASGINSPTLAACAELGMHLHFIAREVYRALAETPTPAALARFGAATIVPAGGYSIAAAQSARFIADAIPRSRYQYICVPVGTATTLAGILCAEHDSKVIAFPAIKGMTDLPQRLKYLGADTAGLEVVSDYHFGGFARHNEDLIGFMNDVYLKYGLPLDKVYTAKMMYAVFDLAKKGYFAAETRILALHTGGLQGNQSLPEGSLIF